ncbi:MAG: hypothetical protein U0694_21190 [Anaerolineae bacterium]
MPPSGLTDAHHINITNNDTAGITISAVGSPTINESGAGSATTFTVVEQAARPLMGNDRPLATRHRNVRSGLPLTHSELDSARQTGYHDAVRLTAGFDGNRANSYSAVSQRRIQNG